MYKELEKLFPDIKLPVKIDENIIKLHLYKQLNNNEKLKIQVEDFFNVYKSYPNYNLYSIDKNNIIKEIESFITNMNIFKEYSNDKDSSYNKSQIVRQSKIVDFYVRHQKEFSLNLQKSDKKELSEKFLFIQFDMIEGNFNVLKEFKKNFSQNENENENDKIYMKSISFNNLIDQIFDTNKEINIKLLNVIKTSKSVRQLIYGSLTGEDKNTGNIPKKNDKMMAYTLSKMYEQIEENIKDFEIVGQSQDEYILAIPKEKITKEFLNEIREKINNFPIRSKIIGFSIVNEIKSNTKDEPKKFYIEEEIDEEEFLNNRNIKINKQKLKSVPKTNYIPSFVKYILNENLIKEDLYIENEGNLYQMIL